MPDEERTAFTTAIADDPALRESVANEIQLYRDLQSAVRYNTVVAPKTQGFKTLLNEIESEITQIPTAALPKGNANWWKFAAAAALLVATITYVFYPKTAANTNELYAQYFAPDCNDTTMGAITPDDNLEKAKKIVCAKQWAQAKTALADQTTPEARFLLVHVLTENKEYEAAFVVLDTLYKNTNVAVEWQRAGVLLKQSKTDECKQILQKIVATQAAHYKDAEELLTTLSS